MLRITNCPVCDIEFTTASSNKRYCTPTCQKAKCRKDEWDRRKLNPHDRCKKLLAGAKNRAKDKSVPFNIDCDYLEGLWELQESRCAVTSIPFNLTYSEKLREPRFDSPSLDRIVPELGYVRGNVRLVIYQVNVAIGPYGLEGLLETISHIRNTLLEDW